jgi:tetratricopeptide (TPR) repeat protein
MSDYHEEEALLWAVNQLFAQDFKLLVSYNGKSYDFPLLQTRYIMTRLPLQLNTSYHLDLLFPTRRLWKRRLQDCSLANIEKKILKIYREEDIPGYLIPHVYFRYLQDKDSRSLKPIFTHNLQDIISLVLLTTKISQTLDDPLSMGKFALDLCSIGKIYEGYKDFQYSSKCYEEALKGNLSDEETLDALKLCSFAYKRQGEWEKAEVAWREIISLNGQFNLYPYEELAKYYEHKLKDYQQAGAIVEEALQRLTKENISWSIKEQWQNSLYFRLERIKRKQRLMSANSKDNQGE